ncbi:MAG: serine/threonine protein kinase [Nitrosomonas sp.]|nr:serine/threonine protein kinase [Nitrosomonas sp.]
MTNIHNQVLPENTRIGVYEIKNVLKIDPINIAYYAWNHHLNERVVVYEYFPGDFAVRGVDGLAVEPKFSSDRENFDYGLNAFLKQGDTLIRIEHSNIAGTENVLQINGTAYLIVSYQEEMSNTDLRYSPGIFSETQVTFILVSLLNALKQIHELKIVHGGINPEAILLNKHGAPILIDFAAARLAIASRAGKLNSVLYKGYAPVELYEKTSEPGPATDFYALGATMYYCMTHTQPVAAQERLIALSHNKPDPMDLFSDALNATYSTNLLKTIDWMLRPEYNKRPQSVTEILATLGSESISNQTEFAVPKQESYVAGNEIPVAKDGVWIFVLVGIIALNVTGLWLGEKSIEPMNESSTAGASASLSQQDPDQVVIEPEKNEKQPVTLVDPETSKESGADTETVLAMPENETQVSITQLTELIEKTALKQPADVNQLETGETQQLPESEKTVSSSEKQASTQITTDNDSIVRHLAAAEKAISEVRFTTPVGNNAYEYYQKILLADPDNVEALAGLQKIVDGYVRLIEKAMDEDQPNTARIYLQRAEAVLPSAPKLHSIRAKLNTKADIN